MTSADATSPASQSSADREYGDASGTTFDDERERRRVEALAMIQEVEGRSRRNFADGGGNGAATFSGSSSLAVHSGEWGGSGPGPSPAAAASYADASDPPSDAFTSLRAFDMAGHGDYGGNGDAYAFERRRRRELIKLVMIAGLVLFAIIVASVTISGGRRGNEEGASGATKAVPDTTSLWSPTGDGMHHISQSDNGFETFTPGSIPPKTSTGSHESHLQATINTIIHKGITTDTSVFEDASSPQYQAAVWLSENPSVYAKSHPNEYQRYGLATFWLVTQSKLGTTDHTTDKRLEGYGALDETDVCDWKGVTCNDSGDVTDLSLVDAGLKGTLPYELFSSTKDTLQSLDLSDNELTGTLSDAIGSMSKLSVLRLENNKLESNIPPKLFSLPKLMELNLANNWFEGPITTTSDGPYAPLKSIVLHDNWLTGDLRAVGKLGGQLEMLDVNSNSLSGTLPNSLFAMANLSYLRLSHNHLTGTISFELGRLTGLKFLSLDRNEFQGTIPSESVQLAQLEALLLYDNFLEGTLPIGIGYMSELQSLVISNNSKMSGGIPDTLGNLKKLDRLVLSNCGLSGPIPAAISEAENLKEFSLDGNFLTGEIPRELGNLHELETLMLNDNKLGGEVPQELSQLKRLTKLHLEGNDEITGEISEDICRLVNEEALVDFTTDCDEVVCSCCTQKCV